jgi:hypothetical protein
MNQNKSYPRAVNLLPQDAKRRRAKKIAKRSAAATATAVNFIEEESGSEGEQQSLLGSD